MGRGLGVLSVILFKQTIQNRFTQRRHRVTGYACGWYRLAEISSDDRFTGHATTMPAILMWLYRVVEPVAVYRCQ